MRRRNFILLTITGTAAVAVSAWYLGFDGVKFDISLVQPRLLSNIWDSETVGEIGKSYCKQFPGEKNKRKLVQLLSAGTSGEGSSLIASIEQRITQDYKENNTVTVDGWILSVTEARQCALFSLTQPK